MDILKAKIAELVKIKRFNLALFLLAFLSLAVSIFWAFFNNDQDSMGEKIFFASSFYVLGGMIYIYFVYARLKPLPKNLDLYFDWQKETVISTYKANRLYQLGYMQLYVICEMGILIMERAHDNNLWKYCIGVLFLGLLILMRSLITSNWAKAEFERLTGENFIPSL